MPHDLTLGADRATALLAGYLGGLSADRGPAATQAALAATTVLAEELLVAAPSLEGVARRWADVPGAAPLDQGTVLGLQHLQSGQGPRRQAAAGESPTLPLLVPPIALLTFDSPANLLSVSWHVAALTHPSDESRWGAVAVNVALARFLQGFRDFVPDAIEALRNNDAPAPLLVLARRLPILPRDEVVRLHHHYVPAVRDAITALWLAHHEPVAARGVAFLLDRGSHPHPSAALPAFSALCGARDAVVPVAPLALPAPAAHIRALALRLARIPHA